MKDTKCEICKFCTKQDKLNQVGLCIEEHSPRNARGEPMKTVHLWSIKCRFFSAAEDPKTFKPRNVKWKGKSLNK